MSDWSPQLPASAGKDQASRSNGTFVTVFAAWILAGIAALPVVFHWRAAHPTDLAAGLATLLSYLVAVSICYAIFRIESRRLSRRQAICLALLVFSLTSVVNHIHSVTVDQGHNKFFSPELLNTDWQIEIQNFVIALSPKAIPHSYRFLPNGIVRWMELCGTGYEAARDAYRLICGLLLFYAISRYAGLYTAYAGRTITLLLVAVAYPISFENYNGQLTDPLSHLSFVLAFLFLGTGEFWALLTVLLIGSLAKETVLIMTLYFVLFHRKEKNYIGKAALLCAGTVMAYFGVRLAILKGTMNYTQVSATSLAHIRVNAGFVAWVPAFLLTAGLLLPFLAIGWDRTPAVLKRQALFLLPVLFLTSLFFGWLYEARNFMPLVFVLAVIAARTLPDGPASEGFSGE
jgi:hypothetical protein